MSGDFTKSLDDKKPFEERVFLRFDAIEEYLRSLDGRVQILESRSLDTKPIWERALHEIVETRQELKETRDELRETRDEVKETRDELKYFKRVVTDRLDQIQSVVMEMRVDGRRAHDRIDKLEARPS